MKIQKLERDMEFTEEEFNSLGLTDTFTTYGDAKIHQLGEQKYFVTVTESGKYKIGFNFKSEQIK